MKKLPKAGDQIKIVYNDIELIGNIILVQDNIVYISSDRIKEIVPILWNGKNWTFLNGDILSQVKILLSFSSLKHNAAFVLPTDNEYVVLGRETKGDDIGRFDAFGGRIDDEDDNNPLLTAAREFSEEGFTEEIFGMDKEMLAEYMKKDINFTLINEYKGNIVKNIIYIAYFIPDFIHQIFRDYHQAYKKIETRNGFHEKDEIAKLKLKDLLQAIQNEKDDTKVSLKADVMSLNGKITNKTIYLRPILVQLLRGYAESRPYTIVDGSYRFE